MGTKRNFDAKKAAFSFWSPLLKLTEMTYSWGGKRRRSVLTWHAGCVPVGRRSHQDHHDGWEAKYRSSAVVQEHLPCALPQKRCTYVWKRVLFSGVTGCGHCIGCGHCPVQLRALVSSHHWLRPTGLSCLQPAGQ